MLNYFYENVFSLKHEYNFLLMMKFLKYKGLINKQKIRYDLLTSILKKGKHFIKLKTRFKTSVKSK